MATLTPLPIQHALHSDLRIARKTQKMTQATLAAKTGLSVPTIRLVERGRSNLSSLRKVIAALDLVLEGGSLPAAEDIGHRVAALRKRRKIGQREFAALVGISQPTLVLLERHNRGRMDTLERALVRLGAGARLVTASERATFFTAAGNSSTHHGWTTPQWLLETLCSVLGKFDLDPCSPGGGSHAITHFTANDDGLSLAWCGTVFMNPPYGRAIGDWTAKAKVEVESANARVVVGLVPARTDTGWWHRDVAGSASTIFLRGRLRFGNSEQSAPFPSALLIWGGTSAELDALRAALPDAWHP